MVRLPGPTDAFRTLGVSTVRMAVATFALRQHRPPRADGPQPHLFCIAQIKSQPSPPRSAPWSCSGFPCVSAEAANNRNPAREAIRRFTELTSQGPARSLTVVTPQAYLTIWSKKLVTVHPITIFQVSLTLAFGEVRVATRPEDHAPTGSPGPVGASLLLSAPSSGTSACRSRYRRLHRRHVEYGHKSFLGSCRHPRTACLTECEYISLCPKEPGQAHDA